MRPEVLHRAELDAATLAALFADLAGLCTVHEVRIRHARGASPTDSSLAGAQEALAAGSASGVQIRYVWHGEAWCDTLVPSGNGARLTRIKAGGGV